jgi:hypothetical protein
MSPTRVHCFTYTITLCRSAYITTEQCAALLALRSAYLKTEQCAALLALQHIALHISQLLNSARLCLLFSISLCIYHNCWTVGDSACSSAYRSAYITTAEQWATLLALPHIALHISQLYRARLCLLSRISLCISHNWTVLGSAYNTSRQALHISPESRALFFWVYKETATPPPSLPHPKPNPISYQCAPISLLSTGRETLKPFYY